MSEGIITEEVVWGVGNVITGLCPSSMLITLSRLMVFGVSNSTLLNPIKYPIFCVIKNILQVQGIQSEALELQSKQYAKYQDRCLNAKNSVRQAYREACTELGPLLKT